MEDFGGVAAITFAIGIIGCVIAVTNFFADRSKEAKHDEHAITSVSTKLDFIGEDVKDIKADQRVFQRDINEVRGIALSAKERADAAHRRIDQIGLDRAEGGEE